MWAYAQWSQTQPIKKKKKTTQWMNFLQGNLRRRYTRVRNTSSVQTIQTDEARISNLCVCCFSFIVIFDQFQIWRVQIMAVRSCELPPPPLRHPSDAINAVVQDMEKDESADKLLCNMNYNTLPPRPSPLLRYTNRKWLVPARQRGISALRPRERSRDHIASRCSFWVSTDTNLTLAAGFRSNC